MPVMLSLHETSATDAAIPTRPAKTTSRRFARARSVHARIGASRNDESIGSVSSAALSATKAAPAAKTRKASAWTRPKGRPRAHRAAAAPGAPPRLQDALGSPSAPERVTCESRSNSLGVALRHPESVTGTRAVCQRSHVAEPSVPVAPRA